MNVNTNIQNQLKEISDNDSLESFRCVYYHYYSRLFRQALYYLNNNPDYAQEVVSDVFIAIWQSRKVLNNVSNPDSYFFIALKHATSRYIEKNYKKQKELLTENLPDHQASNTFTDTDLLDRELQDKYKAALGKLPPRCADVFRLVREEHKKYSEVADILGISTKTVDNQMNKAVKILYQELRENLFSVFF